MDSLHTGVLQLQQFPKILNFFRTLLCFYQLDFLLEIGLRTFRKTLLMLGLSYPLFDSSFDALSNPLFDQVLSLPLNAFENLLESEDDLF